MKNKTLKLFSLIFILTSTFLIIISNLYSQVALPGWMPPDTMPEIIPYRAGNLWGYSDISGKIIITPKFLRANFFCGKIAVIEFNDSTVKKFGLINPDGDTSWTYDNSPQKKFGLITPDGNIFNEFVDNSIYTVSDTSVLVEVGGYSGKYHIIDIHKNKTNLNQYKDVSYISNYGIAQTDSNCYLLNGKGTIIREINCDSVNNRMYNSMIPIEKLYEFNNGFAYLGYDNNNFIDKNGNKYTSVNWIGNTSTNASHVQNKVIFIKKDNQIGVLDSTANIIIPFGQYDKIDEFSNGMAKVYINEELIGFINTKGEELKLNSKIANPDNFFGGFAKVETGKNFSEIGFINKKGEILKLKKRYDEVGSFSEGLCLINFADKYGFIDTTGKEVIPATLDYEYLENFSDGLCKVKKDTLYGFIDKNGKEVIPPSFTDVTSFFNGVAHLDYARATAYYKGSDSFIYRLNLINKKGEKLPYYFEEDEEWTYGYHIINDTENGLKGLIDSNGNVVVNCQYEYIHIYSNGLAGCSFDTQTSYINLKNGVKYFNE